MCVTIVGGVVVRHREIECDVRREIVGVVFEDGGMDVVMMLMLIADARAHAATELKVDMLLRVLYVVIMSKRTNRSNPIMVRMSDEEAKGLHEVTELLKQSVPGSNFTQSDTLRFALKNLLVMLTNADFRRGMGDRFAMNLAFTPIKKTES